MSEDSASSLRRCIVSSAQAHPVSGFFALAFGISWIGWLPLFLVFPDATSVVMIPGAFGPALAAVLMTRLHGESVSGWLTDGLHWRIDSRWYLVALGLPLGLALALGGVLAGISGSLELSRLAGAAPMFPISVLVLTLVGGGQEEFGWRGYALPALQARFDALTASVVIGVVWAVWHLPAFIFEIPGYTGSFGLYALLVTGFSVVLTWLYNATNGSIIAAMLLHGGVNAAPNLGVAVVGGFSGIRISPHLALVPLVWVVAFGLLIKHGPEKLAAETVVTGPVVDSGSQLTRATADGTIERH